MRIENEWVSTWDFGWAAKAQTTFANAQPHWSFHCWQTLVMNVNDGSNQTLVLKPFLKTVQAWFKVILGMW